MNISDANEYIECPYVSMDALGEETWRCVWIIKSMPYPRQFSFREIHCSKSKLCQDNTVSPKLSYITGYIPISEKYMPYH